MTAKYTLKAGNILKDGHTMFPEDVVKDLNRKSYLESKLEAYKGEDKMPSDEEIEAFNKNEDKKRICATLGCNRHPEKGNNWCKDHQLYWDNKP